MVKLTRAMQNTIVHNEGATSLEGAVGKVKLSGSVIKLGLDIHAKQYVVVAQYDQLLPKAARRFWPGQFAPWVESLLRQGHTVHVVYEACGMFHGNGPSWCATVKSSKRRDARF